MTSPIRFNVADVTSWLTAVIDVGVAGIVRGVMGHYFGTKATAGLLGRAEGVALPPVPQARGTQQPCTCATPCCATKGP